MIKTFRIQWRRKDHLPSTSSVIRQGDHWTDIENEQWANPIHAEDRLKYWSHLSLSSLIEFRVNPVEMEGK